MQTDPVLLRPPCNNGFILPVVLIVVSALLILAVGILEMTGIERRTARSFADHQRAKLAASAGLEELREIFTREATNDDFIILQATLAAPLTASNQAAPQLFLARGQADGSAYTYRYIPLFSNLHQAPESPILKAPAVEPLVGTLASEYLDFTTLPYYNKVRVSWQPLTDDQNRTIARYAYWVEDLQSRIDPTIVGNSINSTGIHTRCAWPFPAAGLNPMAEAENQPDLNQIALYAIDPEATNHHQGDLAKNLFQNRSLLISPNSLFAAAAITPPLSRLSTGQLADLKTRAVEESLVTGLKAYEEQALVPFTPGIHPTAAGKPKLNLNRLLAVGGSAAVDQIADFIHQSLPNFERRKGGFPDNYLKTLAANALDYADADSDSTTDGSTYRGIDAYPLVSEFLMRFRWENVLTEGGRKYVVLKVATYAELWNMTDQPVSGTAELTHDTRYTLKIGVNPEEIKLAEMSTATPSLTQSSGYHWLPPIYLSLHPNEYRVVNFGEVTYKLDAGNSSFLVPSPLTLKHEKYGISGAGYQLKWNGRRVDQSRGGIHRNDSTLYFPSGDRQAVRATNPATAYKIDSFSNPYMNNMGDPRMSFYLQAPQEAVAYPVNYSPNRRNIRYEIYNHDVATKTKVQGRVMPSEWPDGGHNSTCESTVGLRETNTQLNPDDPKFALSAASILHQPASAEAPVRLSNQSRFYSATELGRISDPIMWNVAAPTAPNLPWGDVETSTAPASTYGGGNTLRIGRPEHPRFDLATTPGMEAYHLLDLFHTGRSRSNSPAMREGPLIQIQGQLNLNTASRDTLRAVAIGPLTMDPKMAVRTSEEHATADLMAPPVKPFVTSPTDLNREAARIADAILLTRKSTPFSSPASLAEVRDSSDSLIFGNLKFISGGTKVERTDSAAEEIFARVYEATTVRSRNFRIWVVGQAVNSSKSPTTPPEVLSEVRKVFTIFADPGKRASDGKINPKNFHLTLLHEADF